MTTRLLISLLVATVLCGFAAGQQHACLEDVNCNDNNLCTNDTCYTDAIVHYCVFEFNELPCNDGNDCTCNDRCYKSQCHGAQIVSGDCRPPGKYVVETWLFVLLATVALISVLLLMFMLCLRFIAPPETAQQYGAAYGGAYQ